MMKSPGGYESGGEDASGDLGKALHVVGGIGKHEVKPGGADAMYRRASMRTKWRLESPSLRAVSVMKRPAPERVPLR